MNKTNEELSAEISELRNEINQLKATLGFKGSENTALPDLICNSLTVEKDGKRAVSINNNADGSGSFFMLCRDGQRLTINSGFDSNAIALYGKNTNAPLFTLGTNAARKYGELNLFTLEKTDETQLNSRVNLRVMPEGGAVSLYNSKGKETAKLFGIRNGSFEIRNKDGKSLGVIAASSDNEKGYLEIANRGGKVRILEGKIEILDRNGTIIAHLP